LWIDADEAVTPELSNELLALWQHGEPPADVYSLLRRTWFVNRWITHCGWYPEKIFRLFKKEKAHFNDKLVHEGLELESGAHTAELSAELEHYSFVAIDSYFRKQINYALLGTEELRKRGKTFSIWNAVARPLFAFFRVYVLRRGFLDGCPGFVIAVGTAFATFVKYAGLAFSAHNSALK
jgi:(heptosyl)LPS beta-1,4-glucosyltransferase